ncbi:hypothetical protein KC350_g21 [Hortaea werneckii]|nr:hypothetical protein KC350_g21 [Hortaea werneckii]
MAVVGGKSQGCYNRFLPSSTTPSVPHVLPPESRLDGYETISKRPTGFERSGRMCMDTQPQALHGRFHGSWRSGDTCAVFSASFPGTHLTSLLPISTLSAGKCFVQCIPSCMHARRIRFLRASYSSLIRAASRQDSEGSARPQRFRRMKLSMHFSHNPLPRSDTATAASGLAVDRPPQFSWAERCLLHLARRAQEQVDLSSPLTPSHVSTVYI